MDYIYRLFYLNKLILVFHTLLLNVYTAWLIKEECNIAALYKLTEFTAWSRENFLKVFKIFHCFIGNQR